MIHDPIMDAFRSACGQAVSNSKTRTKGLCFGLPCSTRVFEGATVSATAMEQIVGLYVRARNRRALEQLKMHRHRLAVDLRLRSKSIYDHGLVIGKVLEDLAAIEKGLGQLAGTAGQAPTAFSTGIGLRQDAGFGPAPSRGAYPA